MKITKLHISDIHIGRRKNTQMIQTMMKMLNEKIDPTEIDYISLSGDIFDRLLSFDSKRALESVDWIYDLADYCYKYNIKLRILKGTHSHDRNQLEMLEKILVRGYPELDFIYINEIMVVKETDHTCLYLPDEIRPTALDIFSAAKATISKACLEKTDSIIMHGSFKHSSGGTTGVNIHNEEDILSLCTGYVVAGHVHKHQVYGRIITPGPVERLSHNHEDPTGMIITREFPTRPEDNLYEFIENDNAKIFKTIDVKSTVYSDLLQEIIPILRGLPHTSEIRLRFSPDNPLILRGTFDDVSELYNFDFCTTTPIEDEEVGIDFQNNVNIMILDNNTLPSLVTEMLEGTSLDSEDIIRIVNRLKD